jgi:HlyD family secretion protein
MVQTNGKNQNRQSPNGNYPSGDGKGTGNNLNLLVDSHSAPEEERQSINLDTSKFEKGVVLRQSPIWSRTMAWSIMGVAVFAVGWAALAKIEQTIPARGQLKPKGTVKEIQAPINGVVKEVDVEDGQKVSKGDTLVIFDSQSTEAELKSLSKIKATYIQENKFYRTLMNSDLDSAMVEKAMAQLKLPLEIQALALNRTSLVEENNLYRIQLSGNLNVNNLDNDQLARLLASDAEIKTRAAAARLEVQQLGKQLDQNQVRLKDSRTQLQNDLQVLAEIKRRNELTVAQAEESLKIEEGILNTVQPLAEEGALAKIQIDRQRQQVQDRYAQLVEQEANGKIEYENQQQQAQSRVAEIEQLKDENNRLQLDIAQAKEEFYNVLLAAEKDLRERMADNDKRIAEIDSQINKVILENEKRIAEINSQIAAAEQTIKYQALKSPVSGTVFDLQAGPGYVPRSGQAEALLKIVPDPGPGNPLIAEVYVKNEDIGFVNKAFVQQEDGIIADVRIDSFPYSEFGDIKGKVYFVGEDALPPDEIHQYYRYPVKVELEEQYLMIKGKRVDLKSGMSVSVNIKVNENRTVLSLFTELFTKKIDSLKDVR